MRAAHAREFGWHKHPDKFVSDKHKGATSVEYGIMLAAIAAVIIATVVALGTEVEALFQAFVTLWSSL